MLKTSGTLNKLIQFVLPQLCFNYQLIYLKHLQERLLRLFAKRLLILKNVNVKNTLITNFGILLK